MKLFFWRKDPPPHVPGDVNCQCEDCKRAFQRFVKLASVVMRNGR